MACRLQEVRELIQRHGAIQLEVGDCQRACNEAIPHQGNALHMSDLERLFDDQANRIRYRDQWELYRHTHERLVRSQEALDNYCQRIDVYESYVRGHYGVEQERWFILHRLHGRPQTGMIDIVARLLNRQIVIYQEKMEIILKCIARKMQLLKPSMFNTMDTIILSLLCQTLPIGRQ